MKFRGLASAIKHGGLNVGFYGNAKDGLFDFHGAGARPTETMPG